MGPRAFLSVSMTYEVVTEESAEHGDAEERGFMVGTDCPFFWRLPADSWSADKQTDYAMAAHETLRLIRGNHCCYSVSVCGDAVSFYSAEPQDHDYHDGSRTEYTIHVKGPARLLRALVRAAKPRHVYA